MDSEGRQSSAAMMVLHNPELLERIFQHLCGCTLVSASLTTKTFSEPALNVLWYEMSSLWPLFRVLPTFEKRTREYVFTGIIRNEHLQRMLYYAKRIRSLHYTEGVDPFNELSRDLVISILMKIDRLGAFVPLRKLLIHEPYNTVLSPLTMPNLEKIGFSIEDIPSELAEIELAFFLQSVASQSRLLRCLIIDGPVTDITLEFLPNFITLEHLTLFLHNSNLPVQFLKRLSSAMPSLRSLRMKITPPRLALPGGPHRLEQPQSMFRLSFPSLETLWVVCNSAQLENLFGFLDAPLLVSVSLTLHQSTPNVSADMHKFIERNGQALKDRVDKLAIIAFVVPSLSFVKSFEALRELVVSALYKAITMSQVTDIFQYNGSWSHSLTRLHLEQYQVKRTNPLECMSIAALCFIADACPNLKSLEIPILHPDEPKKCVVVKEDEQKRKPHDLQRLIFLNLPDAWDDTMPLAIELVSLLGHLFPSMPVPSYTGGAEDKPWRLGGLAKREAWWKGVQDMWRMCQTMKDRESLSV